MFELSDAAALIGRASEVVPLSDNTVSRRHAEVRFEEGQWTLIDLKSANGTYLNGKRVERPIRLKAGDTIRVGGTVLLWGAEDRCGRSRLGAGAEDFLDLDAGGRSVDTSIITSVASNDDSMILASPAAADAVRSWRVLSQLAEAIATVAGPEGLLERLMDILLEEFPVNRGFVLMRGEAEGELIPAVVRFRSPSDATDKITTSRTIIDQVVTRKEGVLCTNAMSDSRFASKRRSGSIQAYNLRSVICAPIMARDDVLGVIHVDNAMGTHVYTEEQLRLITAIGRMAGLAVENSRLVAQRLENARLAATGQAVASLSHGIKNILQGMRSGADVVELGLARQQLGTVDQGWQIVQRNLEKTYNLTMNMLAYAKEREPRYEMAQLNTLVGEVLELMKRRAEDKGVMVRTDLEEPFPPIPIDVDGIQQVILNVFVNAIDAVPKMTGVINVRTRFDAKAHEAIVSVGDNGPGIAPSQLAHIFTPFHSTKGQGGTGLGLAVTKKIVDEHRGRVDLKSEVGHGTLMTISLPTIAPTSADSSDTQGPGV